MEQLIILPKKLWKNLIMSNIGKMLGYQLELKECYTTDTPYAKLNTKICHRPNFTCKKYKTLKT